MYCRTYLALGVLLGTLLGYALSKKRDMRTGLSVGIGLALVGVAFLELLF
jgi:hypothetical protein